MFISMLTRPEDCPMGLATDGEFTAPTEAANTGESTLYLHDISVAPAFRGNGVSQLLVARLEQLATDLDARTITLTAVCGAWEFWERLGFQELGRSSTAFASCSKLSQAQAERLSHYPPEAGDARLMVRATGTYDAMKSTSNRQAVL